MNYFEEVYLKRMNIDGNNLQERVKTRKEKEFNNLFLQRSKYQAFIKEVNEEEKNILCSIQPAKWGQDKITSNVMVPTTTEKFKTGDILRIVQTVKNIAYNKFWLIYLVNNDITHGYQAYEVIELDSFINHTNEYGNTLHVIPVKFVNEPSVFVQDKFSSYGAVSYREPLAHRKFITSDFDFLKKTMYFEYKKRGWEIVGKDNLSIDGVAYVSIEEFLVKEAEPITSKDILVGEDTNFLLNFENRGD